MYVDERCLVDFIPGAEESAETPDDIVRSILDGIVEHVAGGGGVLCVQEVELVGS